MKGDWSQELKSLTETGFYYWRLNWALWSKQGVWEVCLALQKLHLEPSLLYHWSSWWWGVTCYSSGRESWSWGAVLSRSIVSDSLWPVDCSRPGSSVHGDSPGKNTGVGCHALLHRIFQPRDRTQVSRIVGGFFTRWATRAAPGKLGCSWGCVPKSPWARLVALQATEKCRTILSHGMGSRRGTDVMFLLESGIITVEGRDGGWVNLSKCIFEPLFLM